MTLAALTFSAPTTTTLVARLLIILVGLALWFWTQRLLARRSPIIEVANAAPIADGLHGLTAPIHRRLLRLPMLANALLISSTLIIDALGCFLIASALLGPSIEPFLGLIILFSLRQVCQTLCPLPSPPDMIWRKPGFPALLVTYGTSNDLFFSGHTAIAVYGAAVLATTLGPVGVVLGCLIVAFEVAAVLVLRAHYTLDVFAGAITALYVHRLALEWSPTIDGWIAGLVALAHL